MSISDRIHSITSQNKLAVVGVSEKKFGGYIYKELKKRGYEVFPVHPTRESFDNDRCLASLKDLPEDIIAAIIAVSPEHAVQVVEDATEAGIEYLWFQQGKDFSEAVALADSRRIKSVSRKCIMMYAEPVTGIHRLHRLINRLLGRVKPADYPG